MPAATTVPGEHAQTRTHAHTRSYTLTHAPRLHILLRTLNGATQPGLGGCGVAVAERPGAACTGVGAI